MKFLLVARRNRTHDRLGKASVKEHWRVLQRVASNLCCAATFRPSPELQFCANRDQRTQQPKRIETLLLSLCRPGDKPAKSTVWSVKVAGPSISQVSVPDRQSLESTITSYVAQGFIVANRTDTSVVLQKQKQFSVLWAVIGFVLCLLPLLIYLIVYAMRPDVEVVEIRIGG